MKMNQESMWSILIHIKWFYECIKLSSVAYAGFTFENKLWLSQHAEMLFVRYNVRGWDEN